MNHTGIGHDESGIDGPPEHIGRAGLRPLQVAVQIGAATLVVGIGCRFVLIKMHEKQT